MEKVEFLIWLDALFPFPFKFLISIWEIIYSYVTKVVFILSDDIWRLMRRCELYL